MSQIKAVLFDKDGTLFDFYATWGVWTKTLLQEESRGDAVLATRMGAAIGYDYHSEVFAKDSMVIYDTPPDIAAALLPFFDGETVEALTRRLNGAAAKVPMVEAVPLIPFLLGLEARGLKLGVATNDGEMPARAHLAASGIVGMFDFIVGSDSGYGGKPAPGMQIAFAEHLGLEGAQIAMVGDSVHDLVAGRAAGMVTVAVLTGVADQDELALHADVVLPDVGHLEAWL
ncbi:HAD family hydrolase [Profundibacter sp.]